MKNTENTNSSGVSMGQGLTCNVDSHPCFSQAEGKNYSWCKYHLPWDRVTFAALGGGGSLSGREILGHPGPGFAVEDGWSWHTMFESGVTTSSLLGSQPLQGPEQDKHGPRAG